MRPAGRGRRAARRPRDPGAAPRHRSAGASAGSRPVATTRSASPSPPSSKSRACSPTVARWWRLRQSNTPLAPHVLRTPTLAAVAAACRPGTAPAEHQARSGEHDRIAGRGEGGDQVVVRLDPPVGRGGRPWHHVGCRGVEVDRQADRQARSGAGRGPGGLVGGVDQGEQLVGGGDDHRRIGGAPGRVTGSGPDRRTVRRTRCRTRGRPAGRASGGGHAASADDDQPVTAMHRGGPEVDAAVGLRHRARPPGPKAPAPRRRPPAAPRRWPPPRRPAAPARAAARWSSFRPRPTTAPAPAPWGSPTGSA